MDTPKTEHMENFSSTLFHNILNPLTVLSLEIDTYTKRGPTLQNQVDSMIHNLTHLEYFVSLLCEQVRPSSFVKQFSLNEEIETAIDIVSYSAKRKNVQLLTLLLHEIKLTGNQLHFHQLLLDLFEVFLKKAAGYEFTLPILKPDTEKVIEITLEKRSKTTGFSLTLSHIDVVKEDIAHIIDGLHNEFGAKVDLKKSDGKIVMEVRFSLKKEKTLGD